MSMDTLEWIVNDWIEVNLSKQNSLDIQISRKRYHVRLIHLLEILRLFNHFKTNFFYKKCLPFKFINSG